MYLTHQEYTDMGGELNAALFAPLSVRAEALLNKLTHGRAAGEDPARDALRYAAFALIGAMAEDQQSGGAGREIAAMSNDGVSITYAAGSGASGAQRAARYAAIAREYLEGEVDGNGVALLYAGVDA